MIAIKKATVFLSLFFCLMLSQTISFTFAKSQSYCWENMDPILKPNVNNHEMVFDVESEVAIFFLPDENTIYSYSFADNNWTATLSADMPGSELGMWTGVSYDPINDVVITAIGNDAIGDLETWSYSFNTNTWTNLTNTIAPPIRMGHGFVYDSTAEKFILFGGIKEFNWEGENEFYHDTWTYDPGTNTWTNVTPSVHPIGRWSFGMVYDSNADKTILFGGGHDIGDGSFGVADNETWAFDLSTTTWTQLDTVTSPPTRSHIRMVYDSYNEISMFFGGDQDDFNAQSDTWIFNYESKAWTELNCTVHPSKRWSSGIAYNSITHEIILCGGLSSVSPRTFERDTWIFTYDETCECFPEKTDYSFLAVTALFLILGNLILIVRRRKKN